MMRVLLYEFVTGGGYFRWPDAPLPDGTLLHEGAAMLDAIVRDCRQFVPAATEVIVPRDIRLSDTGPLPGARLIPITCRADLTAALRTPCDVALVIAPETDGHLLQACRAVRSTSTLLLNASDHLIELAASKHNTARWLAQHNVPCPVGTLLCDSAQTPPVPWTGPVVVKPDDGCGSQHVQRFESIELLPDLASDQKWRVEQWVPGSAASLAALCGQGQVHWLAPCWQQLEAGSLSYTGSALITDKALQQRAWRLVRPLEPLLADAVGYIGIDIVLGDPSDGSVDCVIEINPRLTTSYVCLRQAYRMNLVEAMFELATTGELRERVSLSGQEID